jgi:hypothetical protein
MSPTDPSTDGNEREVLGSLPKTRPERRSSKRDRPARAPRAAATASPRAASGAKRASAKPAAPAAKRPKAAARKTGARAKIGADAKPSARARTAPSSRPSKPVPPAGYGAPRAGRPAGAGDLVGTAVQAAGELAEIGATLAGQALRSALRRLPRP